MKYSAAIALINSLLSGGTVPEGFESSEVVEALNERVRKVNSEASSLRTRLRTLESILDIPDDADEATRIKAAEDLAKAQASSIRLTSQVQTLEAERDQAKSDLDAAKNKITELSAAIESGSGNSAELQTQLEASEARASELETSLSSLQKQHADLERDQRVFDAAAVGNFSPQVVKTLLKEGMDLQIVDIKDGEGDDAPVVKQVQVVCSTPGETENAEPIVTSTAFSEYANANWQPFIPALFPNQPDDSSSRSSTKTPRSTRLPAGGNRPTPKSPSEDDVVSAALARHRNRSAVRRAKAPA